MITKNKKRKIAFYIFSLVCFVAITVCLICDTATGGGLTWSGYPVGGILFSWAIATPLLLVEKHVIISTLTAISIATLPFLFFLEYLTPVKSWFSVLGFPIAITCIIAMWSTYCVLRFLKLNLWFLAAIIVFIYGVFVNSIAHYFVSRFNGQSFINLGNFIGIFAGFAITALLVIIGHGKISASKSSNSKHKKTSID